ncbi:MAG: FAD-dependent oxidoreductase, partial [Pseudomonadota bacterium]
PDAGPAGVLLAGDWTDTGLPATIEGAARSGVAAAKLAENRR